MRLRFGWLLLWAVGCSSKPLSMATSPAPATSVPTTTSARSPMDVFVDSILALMTLDEKAGQLNLGRSQWIETGPRVPAAGEADVRAGKVGSFF
jgi:hypothetical protein